MLASRLALAESALGLEMPELQLALELVLAEAA